MNDISQHVLVVDDEPDIRELLHLTLSRMGLDVTTAEDLGEARRAMQSQAFSFCLTDMRLPDGNGLDLVEEVSERYPNLPIAVITAHGKIEDAVYALKIGAFDFVSKPVDLAVLRKLVNTALKIRKSDSGEADRGEDKAAGKPDSALDKLTGSSPAIKQCKAMIAKLARSQAPVLVSGDSGSGKELAARLIHDLGPRADGPFIPVNCGAIPTELMESEFFGHRKGSFTGAAGDKDGLFQAADGGTLMLDEVADLPLHMQVKLLRVIQEKAVMPIGARAEVPVDVRILSATHKPLKPLVESGKFRSDLYFRLNVIELPMPGLQDRVEDIPELANRFLAEITEQWEGDRAPEISDAAMETLKHHNYTGNVRELINILQRAVTMCEGNVIQPADLLLEHVEVHDSAPTETEKQDDQSLDTYMEEIERKMLEDALRNARYNKTRAAELLGISFRSFRYKLKKYGIE
ncbi:MAG: sigma-54-dependent Fis family transcriptional regulator [Xanthomonadales bacterium]|nr:sigma-54 dependent transcriptional regulator [Gammaproteobacteria bacterium]MBT8053086.1 sigma-54 dependent transcriptional regulator [Gammaproteobacteria bacterium]NND56670.1 sigma-54-dependent Fis family transcriptional regulator [Xanthomonadales bacterium]NNK52655.1 sigma-54-dependent Fis family transcriptional regulator [Xanthomonadales bacterium]